LWGFKPATYHGPREVDHLHLAFNGARGPLGVCLRESNGRVEGDVHGGDAEQARGQVARILSLDLDGSGFNEIGRRDRVVGRLQTEYPGLRPVLWVDPYEAACWAVISTRISMVQAARTKERLAEELGGSVEIHGELHRVFPSPQKLLENATQLATFRGLFGRKPEYLLGIARAALDGKLDADRLRSLPAEQAIEQMKQLSGIGQFGAELIVLRGAGEPDFLPSGERRLLSAIARLYELPDPPPRPDIQALAEKWRPFRTWVCVLLRASAAGD
nr:DNA-3-methyladenine glycosylase 2 family protein [Candidatus Dormibacteraeota bacterium]